MQERSEQRFYSKLKDTFVGEKIKGDSGYVNLMNLRQKYFERIEPHIREKVDEEISEESAKEELYDKLYTFFDAYLNETGTVFFANTQIHKNLYERVYSDRNDVSLFWKTKNLYYVKSEALYDDLETKIDGITFKFDASSIKHSKGNEKKRLEFHLTKVDENTLTFKPRYSEQNKYDKLREYTGSKKILDYIYENYPEIKHPQVKVITNNFDHSAFSKTQFKSIVSVRELSDAVNTVQIEFAPYKIEDILKYLSEKDILISNEQIQKAFRIYKKQNEVDYFIHKDAAAFLKEQFDIYLYNYLFNDLETEFSGERVGQIQKIKNIAHKIIEYIACFEDELKAIWNKPKFARKSNFVLTLDRIADNIELIEELISHPGFKSQLNEYRELEKEWVDEEGNITKKEWDDFNRASNCSIDDIIIKENGKESLNPDFKFLPIDTKHFGDFKWKIINEFDDLDKSIDGYLIKSDNYQVLNTLLPKFRDKVDLIYIDPPFNTGDDFLYKDKYQDSTWLTLMENRLELSREMTKSSGSFFLHLDYRANYLGRQLMEKHYDKINNEIVWCYSRPSVRNQKNFTRLHDTIYWYLKNKDKLTFNSDNVRIEYSDSTKERNKYQAGGSKYAGGTNERQTHEAGKIPEDYWDISIELDDWYIPLPPGNDLQFMYFDTQKPEALLHRIISAASDKGDLIMDYFLGSATTIAVAHKLDRKWIGVDFGEYFDTKIIPRMKKVLIGDRSGISKGIWEGGGMFKYYELEQYEDALARSLYSEESDDNSGYNFGAGQKQLEAIEIDYKNEQASVHFEKLYNDVDIAETLSNLTGKRIKKLNKKRMIFEDDQEVVFKKMTFGEYPWIKPLIWWNSRKTQKN